MSEVLAYLFTDFHAHLFKDFSKPDEHCYTDRFKASIDTLITILDQAKTDEVPVIFGGDLFHRRTYVDSRVLNAVFKVFASHPEVPVYMVRGNHDSVTNSIRTVSSLDVFSFLPNVTVITEPRSLVIETQGHSLLLYGLPYGEETAEMKSWLNEQAETLEGYNKIQKALSLLVAHIGVEGATTGRHSHTLEGAFTVGDLHPETFDAVYLGHYHKRQELLPNVIYGGNTIQTSFSDEGQVKGYHALILEGETLQMQFKEIPNKMFITVTGDEIPDNETLTNNYIRFVGTEEQAKAVQALKDTEQLMNLRITVQKDYNDKARLGITTETSEEEIVTAYIKSKALSETVIEKALKSLKIAKDLQ